MTTANEHILYQEGNILVTDTYAALGDQRYPLSAITSVSLTRPILDRTYGIILLVMGIIVLVAGYFVWGVLLTPVIAGAAMIAAGAAVMFVGARSHPTVRLNGSSGAIATLPIHDPVRAQQLVGTLSQLVAKR